MSHLSWKMISAVHGWLRAFVGYAVTLTLLNLGIGFALLITAALLVILELLDEGRRRGWLGWNFLDPEGFNVLDLFWGVVGGAGALLLWSFGL